MNIKRKMLRHFLAALAYRTQKALREAPEEFANFDAGSEVRTPHELVLHMRSVLGYARTFFIGGRYPKQQPKTWQEDIKDFHYMIEDLGKYFDSDMPLVETTEERLLQGPLSDAMTHAGQLAMLRRLAGYPVPAENFVKADINDTNLTPNQPAPISPDKDWSKDYK